MANNVYSGTDRLGFVLSVNLIETSEEGVVVFTTEHPLYPGVEEVTATSVAELREINQRLREAGADV